MEINDILASSVKMGASDIHIKAGLPPMFRMNGTIAPMEEAKRLAPEDIVRMAFGMMTDYQKEKFRQQYELDLAYGVPGLGRFRVNVFQQRGTIGMVMRSIPFKIMSIDQLMLPKILEKISGESRGLVLVTGTTGSGKSTTLAAMIDHINTTETCHIMTVEDPIEFLIRDKRSLVNQRELGVDTMSFAAALKSAMRQDPDVILVGEMRDMETIETALTAAETGHLVFSTLHTLDASETINRIIGVFPPHQQKQIRMQLGSVLKSVVSQRLVPKADGKGRVAAVEVMICTSRIREMIEDKERTRDIPQAIAQGFQTYGMQTFDQSLMSLVSKKYITYEEALRQTTNPDDFALRFSGIASTSDGNWGDFEGGDAPQAQAVQYTPAPQAPAIIPAPKLPANTAPPAIRPPMAVPKIGGASPQSLTTAPPTVRPQAPAVRPVMTPIATPKPVAPAAKPAPTNAVVSDDDFQIDRF